MVHYKTYVTTPGVVHDLKYIVSVWVIIGGIHFFHDDFLIKTQNLINVLCLDDMTEAYNLIKDLEPTTPQEYILKGVVNAALGQEQGSVSYCSFLFSHLRNFLKLCNVTFWKCRVSLIQHVNRFSWVCVEVLSPAHTMRFLSSVGRRDDEKTIVAWCVWTKDDCRPLILQTRQLLDRFENESVQQLLHGVCGSKTSVASTDRPQTNHSEAFP